MRLFFSLLAGFLVAGLTVPADARPSRLRAWCRAPPMSARAWSKVRARLGRRRARHGYVAKGTAKGLRCVVTLGNRC